MRNLNKRTAKTFWMSILLVVTLSLAACTSSGSEPTASENENENTSVDNGSALTEVDVNEDSIVENVEEVDSTGPASLPVAESEDGEEIMPEPDNSDSQDDQNAPVEPVTVNLSEITPEADGNNENVVQPAPGVPDNGVRMANIAMEELAGRLTIDISEIDVVSIEEVEWNDGSLGCPQEGYAYTQAIVPGYQIMLQTADGEYAYHTDGGRQTILCVDGSPAP